jgi:hypothetical protein
MSLPLDENAERFVRYDSSGPSGLDEQAAQQRESAKVNRLLELLSEFPDKLVLFTQFRATQEMLLSGVPRQGDHIRRPNGKPGQNTDLIVEQVTWTEGQGRGIEPETIISVREYPPDRRH